jgi:hypothetical protein
LFASAATATAGQAEQSDQEDDQQVEDNRQEGRRHGCDAGQLNPGACTREVLASAGRWLSIRPVDARARACDALIVIVIIIVLLACYSRCCS